MQRSLPLKRAKTLMRLKFKNSSILFQTYELSLPSQRKIKSLGLKTINERVEGQHFSDKDEVKKEVAYLAKNFLKFLRDGKSFEKGKFSNFKKDKKDFKNKDSKEYPQSQMVMCFECKGMGM